MIRNESDVGTINELISGLSSQDPVVRTSSREKLVKIGGHTVTRALVAELVDPRKRVRWEAAKALTEIADPVSVHGLLHALDDEDEEVRWIAGEGLIALRRDGLLTVLSGLTRRARSLDFCKSAHHVLHDLRAEGCCEVIAPVLKALQTSEPELTAPPAAYAALQTLKGAAG